MEDVIRALVRAAEQLNTYWPVKVIPGVEITHIPVEAFREMTRLARSKGARLVVAHGESPVEPVAEGTNRAAIESGVDILAHPGNISAEDCAIAAERGVCLELTTRKGHERGNAHVYAAATENGASMVIDTDTHSPGDLLDEKKIFSLLESVGAPKDGYDLFLSNSRKIAERCFKS
jgi:histidinol phosphatase-like PHP family hydrolase